MRLYRVRVALLTTELTDHENHHYYNNQLIFIGVIFLKNIVRSLITESMTFAQLLRSSTPSRKDRASTVAVNQLPVLSSRNGKYWNFSFKSNPSTTGKQWKGRITFLKAKKNVSADQLMCEVDCGCPDYRFRWAYANNNQDAGPLGSNSLNKSNGAPARITNPRSRPGLCKHLIALRNQLRKKLTESQQPTLDTKLDEVVDKYPEFTIEVGDDNLEGVVGHRIYCEPTL